MSNTLASPMVRTSRVDAVRLITYTVQMIDDQRPETWQVIMTFRLFRDGLAVGTETYTSPLWNGAPRFSQEVYNLSRAELYRIAAEDHGIVLA